MSVWVDMAVCVVYAVVLYAVYLIRINRYKIDRDWIEFRAQLQANEIINKFNELNEVSAFLNKASQEVVEHRQLNLAIRAELEEKNQIVNEIHADNLILLENNKETLKENKLQLYNVREATLNLYKQYKEMSDLIRHLLVFDDGESGIFQHLRRALDIVNKAQGSVNEYFKTYFRMTADQYISQKEYIVGKKSNGSDHVTDCSAN